MCPMRWILLLLSCLIAGAVLLFQARPSLHSTEFQKWYEGKKAQASCKSSYGQQVKRAFRFAFDGITGRYVYSTLLLMRGNKQS